MSLTCAVGKQPICSSIFFCIIYLDYCTKNKLSDKKKITFGMTSKASIETFFPKFRIYSDDEGETEIAKIK